jgi:hypothetical protein
MKKQTKKSKIHWQKKTVILATMLILLGMVGSTLGVQKALEYKGTADRANLVEIRELILLAVRGVKKDAPVDARTGDIYFPESRLYLPNPGMALPLTYLQDTGDIADSQSELSISTYPVRGTEALYMAKNQTDLFSKVPKLQACSRGIKVVHQQFPSSDTTNILKHTVHLQNGHDVYIYLEKACPELDSVADTLVNLRSY